MGAATSTVNRTPSSTARASSESTIAGTLSCVQNEHGQPLGSALYAAAGPARPTMPNEVSTSAPALTRANREPAMVVLLKDPNVVLRAAPRGPHAANSPSPKVETAGLTHKSVPPW